MTQLCVFWPSVMSCSGVLPSLHAEYLWFYFQAFTFETASGGVTMILCHLTLHYFTYCITVIYYFHYTCH